MGITLMLLVISATVGLFILAVRFWKKQRVLDAPRYGVSIRRTRHSTVYCASLLTRCEMIIEPIRQGWLNLSRIFPRPKPLNIPTFDKLNLLLCDNMQTRAALVRSPDFLALVLRLRALEPAGTLSFVKLKAELSVPQGHARKTRSAGAGAVAERQQLFMALAAEHHRSFASLGAACDPGRFRLKAALFLASIPFAISLILVTWGPTDTFVAPLVHWAFLAVGAPLGLAALAASLIPLWSSSHLSAGMRSCLPLALAGALGISTGASDFVDHLFPRSITTSHVALKELTFIRKNKSATRLARLVMPVDLADGQQSQSLSLSRRTYEELTAIPLGSTLLITHGMGLTGSPVILSIQHQTPGFPPQPLPAEPGR